MKFYHQNKVDDKTININASTLNTLVTWLYCVYFQLHKHFQLSGCLENGVIRLAIVNMKNANSRFRIGSARYKGLCPKIVIICRVQGPGFEYLRPQFKASPNSQLVLLICPCQRIFFVGCEGRVGVLSAFIFMFYVVFLLIGIVLELLRGCLHHGP